ncbi:MAG: type II secretion system F family protein, partial [Sphingopyxis sp.]|nr:type II secretion system F family protein [Sphingopyxis sp.]
MADFRYLAVDPAGREKRGHIAAPDREAARAALTQRRLFVIECAPGPPPEPKKALLTLERNKLSQRELALFTRQLATLTEVSPLEEALRTSSRQSEAAHVRAIIGTVHSGIVEGRRLAEAMGREPKSFPPLYRAMISAGESSGSLPTILDRLSALLERQAEVRGKLMATLAYPIVLATVAVLV